MSCTAPYRLLCVCEKLQVPCISLDDLIPELCATSCEQLAHVGVHHSCVSTAPLTSLVHFALRCLIPNTRQRIVPVLGEENTEHVAPAVRSVLPPQCGRSTTALMRTRPSACALRHVQLKACAHSNSAQRHQPSQSFSQLYCGSFTSPVDDFYHLPRLGRLWGRLQHTWTMVETS